MYTYIDSRPFQWTPGYHGNILLKQDYIEFLGCNQDQKVHNHRMVTIRQATTVNMVKNHIQASGAFSNLEKEVEKRQKTNCEKL